VQSAGRAIADHESRGAIMGEHQTRRDAQRPAQSRTSTSDLTLGGKDVVTISYWGDEPRWHSEVSLGPTPHELGEFATLSMALNAAVKFYYEQRPAARRRRAGKGT
jgi:hypothetical protein